jgi:dihydrofolate reductase
MEVILVAATTIDGYIARSQFERSFDWTSPEDKRFYIDTIKSSDAIIMGKTSFQTFTKHPKNTDWYIYTKNPEAFTNPNPSVITAQGTSLPPQELIQNLKTAGKKRVVVCGGSSIYTQCMQAQVITKLYLTIEPVIFGGGIKLFDKPFSKQLQLDSSIRLSEKTVVLEYSVI